MRVDGEAQLRGVGRGRRVAEVRSNNLAGALNIRPHAGHTRSFLTTSQPSHAAECHRELRIIESRSMPG